MRSWFMLVVLLVCLAVVPALAKELTVTRLDNTEAVELGLGGMVRQVCAVGNLHDAAWAVGGWMLPPESYKLAFDPADGCAADCPNGWKLTSVHILLQTVEACDLTMSVDLEDASYPNGLDCPFPGPVDCVAGPYLVGIPQAGMWDIELPIECDCAFFDYIYFLSVEFLDISCTTPGSYPDLVTDDSTAICCSYNNWGAGWQDLVDLHGFPGNLMIYGDAECCDTPVAETSQTWGAVKGLYR